MKGKKFRPMYTVVSVDKEKSSVVVKNERGKQRLLEAKDLFTQAGIERYWKRKYFELLKLLREVTDTEALKKGFDNKVK